jgi:hypothetical protein
MFLLIEELLVLKIEAIHMLDEETSVLKVVVCKMKNMVT